MQTPFRRMRPLKSTALALLGLALGALQALAAPLAQDGLVFVVRSGNSFVVADSSNTAAKRLWDKVHRDPEVIAATRVYEEVQSEEYAEIRAELAADGSLSSEDRAVLADLPQPEPVYVEVQPGTGGAYNDWKAVFQLRGADGRSRQVTAPRIVFQADDPVTHNADAELFPHTLVHEIAHGFHAQLVGHGNTPRTPWLSRPHSGNTTSDGTLALIEGYAEFVAAYLTDRHTIASDPHDALGRNLYVYEPTGELKSEEDLWATEGWAATVLLDIAEQIPDGFDKINAVLRADNPDTFQGLIQGLQERFPSTRSKIDSILNDRSKGQITSGDAGGGGTWTWSDLGDDDDGDSKLGKTGKVIAAVIGGALGATFGVSFGPVGIIVAAAAGAGAGYFLVDMIFGNNDDGPSAAAFDWKALNPFSQGSGGGSSASVGFAPAAASSGEAASERFHEAYRRYLDALDGGNDVAIRAARGQYEVARQRYQAAIGGR